MRINDGSFVHLIVFIFFAGTCQQVQTIAVCKKGKTQLCVVVAATLINFIDHVGHIETTYNARKSTPGPALLNHSQFLFLIFSVKIKIVLTLI